MVRKSGMIQRPSILAVVAILLLALPANSMMSSQNDGSSLTSPWLLYSLGAVFQAAQNHLWSNGHQEQFDVEREIAHMLREIRERPAPLLEEFQIWGNADFANANLIILNEDPFDAYDIEAIMRFIRHHAEEGDAVIFEGDGHSIDSLEGLFLMRVLCLQALALEESAQRERRRELVAGFGKLLASCESLISQNRFLADGAFAYRCCSDGQEQFHEPRDLIDLQIKNQIATISEAVLVHKRVF